MPQRVICHKCGTVLYEGEELKTPYEIIESYDGKCPNCRRKLSDTPKIFDVKPIDMKLDKGLAVRMRRQEMKSRKKMHAQKKWKRKSLKPLLKKEKAIEKYTPKVINLDKLGKHIKGRKFHDNFVC